MKKKAKKKSDAKKYEEVRLLLEKRKAEILKEVAGDLSEGLNSETVAYPDLSDLASIESDKNFEIRIKERERRLLKKINLALEQIKNGTFGICERCGEEIGLKRLLARPVATLCIQCKTEAEREEKARNL
ncbi:MAG: RNA polymerase-binding protein DksA [Candidatus Schekmanbacteria bacterium]|nr:MAG: RNA polymerase-binding protein DksA [Candidatus Schekmanbacteria bacterium]